MTPQELWDEFEEAYYQCPQSQTMDDDQREHGQPKPYGKLKRKYSDVIGYWLSKNTIGGSMLLENGYIETLCPSILEMCDQYQKEVKQAKKEIALRVFGDK